MPTTRLAVPEGDGENPRSNVGTSTTPGTRVRALELQRDDVGAEGENLRPTENRRGLDLRDAIAGKERGISHDVLEVHVHVSTVAREK